MLEAKMKDFGKIMVSVFTKDLRMDSPSTSGEFIRYKVLQQSITKAMK